VRTAKGLNPAKHIKATKRKYSRPVRGAGPIPWHVGWEMMSWANGVRPAQSSRQEQYHFGVEHQVILSTMPMVVMGDGSANRQRLTASLEGRTGPTGPRVLISQNDGSGVAATLDEAKRFALGILALVDETQR